MKAFIFVLFGLLFAVSVQAAGTTKAKIDLSRMGWVADKSTEVGKSYLIRNVGNNGGVVTFGCNAPGEDALLKYTYKGERKDFFILELLTDGIADSYPYVALYGVKSMDQAAVYKQLAMTDSGFMMTRFANGAAERFYKSRKDREVYGVPKPMGTELFVGHEQVADFINDIKAVCKHTEEPLY